MGDVYFSLIKFLNYSICFSQYCSSDTCYPLCEKKLNYTSAAQCFGIVFILLFNACLWHKWVQIAGYNDA